MGNPISGIGEEQIETLKTTKLQDGSTAYDYVMSWPEEDQPWASGRRGICDTGTGE